MSQIIWQIGTPNKGSQEFDTSGGWTQVFNYTVGTDADPINHPKMPSFITTPAVRGKPKRFSTEQLNIHFTLQHHYAEGELTLFYDRFGRETDTLTLDGRLLKKIRGAGEGKLQQSTLPLPPLSSGQHTLTIITRGGDGHYIDYLKLSSAQKKQKEEPVKMARGSTTASNTTWQQYEIGKSDQGIFIDIDTSAAGFTKTPKYFTALAGEGDLSKVKGIHAIYNPSPTGFRLYLYQPQPQLTPQIANDQKWQVHWMAVAEGVMEAEGQDPEILCVGGDNQLYTRDTLTSKWVLVPNSGSVIAATIMPDGKVLGIGLDRQLWYRETLTSKWVNVPNSGSVMGVTILPDGKILGVGTDNQLYTRDTLTSKWQHIPNSGSVTSVTVLPDGKIVGVGIKNQLWYRETLTSSWVKVPKSGSVISITALPNGKIVGVGTDYQLWYRNTLTSKWVLIPNSASPRTIAYGGNVNL